MYETFPLFGPEMQKIHLHRKKWIWSVLGSVSRSDKKAIGVIFVLLDSRWSALNVYQNRNEKILETVSFTRGQSLKKWHKDSQNVFPTGIRTRVTRVTSSILD